MTIIRSSKRKILLAAIGLIIIVIGIFLIFAFSAQVEIPAQPGTLGYLDYEGGRVVWRRGTPAQPEHFETVYPNFLAGLLAILVGVAIFVAALFYTRQEESELSLLDSRS